MFNGKNDQKSSKENSGSEFKLSEQNRLKFILQGLLELQKYPVHELYRIFVDGCLLKEENGWTKYEAREKGCLAAVFCAFAFALDHICDKDFTVDLIVGIHERCITSVDGKSLHGRGHFNKLSEQK